MAIARGFSFWSLWPDPSLDSECFFFKRQYQENTNVEQVFRKALPEAGLCG